MAIRFYDVDYLRGINVAGGEFDDTANALPGVNGVNFAYQTAPLYQYLRGRGHLLARIPFKWERVQHAFGQPLDPTGLAELRATIRAAEQAGLRVLIDMHNYGRFRRTDNDAVVAFGNGITADDFTDVWTRLSLALRDHHGIVGLGLMNEPHDLGATPVVFTKRTDLQPFDAGIGDWQVSGTGRTIGVESAPDDPAALTIRTVMPATSGAYAALRANGLDSGPIGQATFTAGERLRADIHLPASNPGTRWRVRMELTRQDNTAHHDGYATLTKGATTPVYLSVPDDMLAADAHKHVAFQFEVDGSDGTTESVMQVTNISVGSTTGGVSHWKTYSQAAVEAIRAAGDTRDIYVSGDSWANANGWPTKNGDPWITDPADCIVYEAHYYLSGMHNGVYGLDFATEEAAAIGAGWASMVDRCVDEVEDFTTWCTQHGVRGFIGEVGWPDDADAAAWNAVGEAIYTHLDSVGMSATYWATGTRWNPNYRLQAYDYGDGAQTFTPRAMAAVIEAHRS